MGDVRLALEGAFETTSRHTAMTPRRRTAMDAHHGVSARCGRSRGRGSRWRWRRVDAVASDSRSDCPDRAVDYSAARWPAHRWPWLGSTRPGCFAPGDAVVYVGAMGRREQLYVRAIDGANRRLLRERSRHQSFLLSRWSVDRLLRAGKAEEGLCCGRDDPDVGRSAQLTRW